MRRTKPVKRGFTVTQKIAVIAIVLFFTAYYLIETRIKQIRTDFAGVRTERLITDEWGYTFKLVKTSSLALWATEPLKVSLGSNQTVPIIVPKGEALFVMPQEPWNYMELKVQAQKWPTIVSVIQSASIGSLRKKVYIPEIITVGSAQFPRLVKRLEGL